MLIASCPDGAEVINKISKRSTDSVFSIATRFVARISNLASSGCKFELDPLSADSLGFETWIWSHEEPTLIEVGNNGSVPLSLHAIEFPYGLYRMPHHRLAVCLVRPSGRYLTSCSFGDWSGLEEQIVNFLAAASSGRVPIPVYSSEYSELISPDQVVQSLSERLSVESETIPIFLLIAPPLGSNGSSDPQLRAIDAITGELGAKLRKMARGAYAVTVGWDGLESPSERQYVIENAMLKGLTVSGAIPWRIASVPTHNTQKDKLCFIGIDVNDHRKERVVGGVAIDGWGTPYAYQLARLPKPNGDRIDPDCFSCLIRDLLDKYKRASRSIPDHVVIHRDGIVGDEINAIVPLAESMKMAIDLVEIRKSGAPILRQKDNIDRTPSKDIAVGSENERIAFLVNTMPVKEKLSDGLEVFPCPNPICIKQVSGCTPLKTLAMQVYMLTLANHNSSRRTERLPITIVCADALVNNARMPPGKSTIGRPIDMQSIMYWL